jgi:hypothetical protein
MFCEGQEKIMDQEREYCAKLHRLGVLVDSVCNTQRDKSNK